MNNPMTLLEALPYMLDGSIKRLYRETALDAIFSVTLDDELRFWYNGKETQSRALDMHLLTKTMFTPVFSGKRKFALLSPVRHYFNPVLRRMNKLAKGKTIALFYNSGYIFKKLVTDSMTGAFVVVEASVLKADPVNLRENILRKDFETKWTIRKGDLE